MGGVVGMGAAGQVPRVAVARLCAQLSAAFLRGVGSHQGAARACGREGAALTALARRTSPSRGALGRDEARGALQGEPRGLVRAPPVAASRRTAAALLDRGGGPWRGVSAGPQRRGRQLRRGPVEVGPEAGPGASRQPDLSSAMPAPYTAPVAYRRTGCLRVSWAGRAAAANCDRVSNCFPVSRSLAAGRAGAARLRETRLPPRGGLGPGLGRCGVWG